MNRGSWLKTLIMSALRTRFNEAPIHESGKFSIHCQQFVNIAALQ